jgi:hypothetical protein
MRCALDGVRRSLLGYGRGLHGVTLAVLVFGSGCQGAESCVVEDECWHAESLQELGRCAPKDVWCRSGECGGRCAQTCEVIDPAVNPCEPDMICTEGKTLTSLPMCTDHPINCKIADDCPIYIPPTEMSGAWECIDSLCRFPGYEYKYQE